MKKVFILAVALVLASCSPATADAPKVPDTGALELTDWQSYEMPGCGSCYNQIFILHDKERNHDYIVFQDGYHHSVTMTERK